MICCCIPSETHTFVVVEQTVHVKRSCMCVSCIVYCDYYYTYCLASIPHHKPLDNLADNIDDPIYQMQKDAFTISKESLSDFKKIGKGTMKAKLLLVNICACAMYQFMLSVNFFFS